MRIAYFTTDEVNLDLARRWARRIGCQLIPLSPREPLLDDQFDAVIYDLDYLPSELRRELLASLRNDPLPGPCAVHSYNLKRREAEALRFWGVQVRRRLQPGLFLRLRREALQRQEATARARRGDPRERVRSYAGSSCWAA
jgi:hypothetical protein